jgi:hypothetical protein
MKRGIEMSWAYDYKDRLVLRIEKKRGKLTLAEIQDLLMYEESQSKIFASRPMDQRRLYLHAKYSSSVSPLKAMISEWGVPT